MTASHSLVALRGAATKSWPHRSQKRSSPERGAAQVGHGSRTAEVDVSTSSTTPEVVFTGVGVGAVTIGAPH
jgi:hypothetical protein